MQRGLKMKFLKKLGLVFCGVVLIQSSVCFSNELANELIDYDAFKTQVSLVAEHRKNRRVSEDEFIRMSKEPNTVVFDARSTERFNQLHVKGAKHLSLPDITALELTKIIPNLNTRILIYCNNNFLNEPNAFPSKAPSASLNIHTFNVLYSYGYKNIYELGPLIDIRKSKIEFEGTILSSQQNPK